MVSEFFLCICGGFFLGKNLVAVLRRGFFRGSEKKDPKTEFFLFFLLTVLGLGDRLCSSRQRWLFRAAGGLDCEAG